MGAARLASAPARIEPVYGLCLHVGVRRIGVAALPLAIAALAAPAAASAHARLIRTAPAAGAVLAHPPREVRVVFDDTVTVGSRNAAVANASLRSVEDGPPTARGRVL